MCMFAKFTFASIYVEISCCCLVNVPFCFCFPLNCLFSAENILVDVCDFGLATLVILLDGLM